MRTLLLALLALTCLMGTAAAAVWPASTVTANPVQAEDSRILDNSPFIDWHLVSASGMDVPLIAFGPPLRMPVNEALEAVKTLSHSHADFQLVSDVETPGKRFLYLREMRDGLPVLSGRIDLVYGKSHLLSRWNLREHSSWDVLDQHLLSIETAASALASTVHYGSWSLNQEQSFAAWYPDHESKILRPVFWIRIEGTLPHERQEGIVDALSGEIILDWPGVCTDIVSGTVAGSFWPEYMHEDPQTAPHAFGTVTINTTPVITEPDGTFSLEAGQNADLRSRMRGPYVRVLNDDIPDDDDQAAIEMTLQAPFSPLNIDWTEEIATRAELNLFHHTTFIWIWYKELDPEFTALDYPMPAVANYGHAYDNAFWNGHGIYFGEGAQYNNFAMYSDIIYHEYTHGVTDGIYPNGMLPYTGQSGSMNEAWSDYFACTINGDPISADWIGGSVDGFRDLESDMVYEGVDHEVHVDSPYISAPLWRIRSLLGAEYADYLAHFSRYALAETYIDYLVAVLDMDDDDNDLTNGTPNYAIIYDAFGRHGIGPDDEPNFVIRNLEYYADGTGGSSGNGNRFIEPGEIVELNFSVVNDVILYPPPATGVSVSVTTEDPDVVIENGVGSVAVLGPAQVYNISGILLNVDETAPDHWTVIDVTVSANGGTVVYEESFEFSVGMPRMLIVQDDAHSDVEKFVVETVRNQNRIFDTIQLDDHADLPDEYIPESGLIVWISGNADGAILTAGDQVKLRDFIDEGNKIVLSGQFLANGLIGTDFLQSTIEAEVMPEATSTRRIAAGGDPFETDSWFLLAGTGGASNQTEMAVLNPLGNSEAVGFYGTSTEYPAIVQFQNDHGLLLGFGIEAISNTTLLGNIDRAAFMAAIYAWAGDPISASPDQPLTLIPSEWSLGPAYPNPFNPSTQIPYAIPSIINAEYRIIDLLGRTVETGILSQKTGTIHWEHSGPSGLYFLTVSCEAGTLPAQKLVLLK